MGAMSRELENVRKQTEEERAHRNAAEKSFDLLTVEVKALRAEGGKLIELRTTHQDLQNRYGVIQTDLQISQQKCTQLESAQEQLRQDIETAMGSRNEASCRHKDLQTE